VGWRKEPMRHSMAAKGIKSGTKNRASASRKKAKIEWGKDPKPKETTYTIDPVKEDWDRLPRPTGGAHAVAKAFGEGKRAQGSNIYAVGDAIYSYGSHFPMAIVDHKNKIVYWNKSKYSVSTSKHQSRAYYGVRMWKDKGYKEVEMRTADMRALRDYGKVTVVEEE